MNKNESWAFGQCAKAVNWSLQLHMSDLGHIVKKIVIETWPEELLCKVIELFVHTLEM